MIMSANRTYIGVSSEEIARQKQSLSVAKKYIERAL